MATPTFLERIITLFVTSLLVVVFSVPVLLRLIFMIMSNPTKFFHCKSRSAPGCLSNDPTLGTHHFITLKKQDIKLHYVQAGQSNKPLLLFLHGFPEFWYSWRHQIRHFQDSYRVVAVDMRGYGQSDKPSGRSAYVIQNLTGDICEFIQALGYSSGTVVAHDWGGAVAWAFAIQYPDLVDNLVVMNCPHPAAFQKHIQTTGRSQILKSWYMFVFQLPLVPELLFRNNDYKMLEVAFRGKEGGAKRQDAFSDDDIEAFKYTFSQPGTLTCAINYYRANLLRKRDGFGQGQKLDVPTLVIWGDDDKFLEKEMASLSGEYVNDFTLHYIPGASHWVQQDEPEQVNRLMRNWLKEQK